MWHQVGVDHLSLVMFLVKKKTIDQLSMTQVFSGVPPRFRGKHQMVSYQPKNQMLVFGGENDNILFNDMWAYSYGCETQEVVSTSAFDKYGRSTASVESTASPVRALVTNSVRIGWWEQLFQLVLFT